MKTLIMFGLLWMISAMFAMADGHQTKAGFWNRNVYTPQFDGVCGLGTDLPAGCSAIREREIVDAGAAPWRAIGRVNFAGTARRHHCTGTLVAPDLVLTAAHCLFNDADQQWTPAQFLTFAGGFQQGDARAASDVQSYLLPPTEDANSRIFRSAPDQDWAFLKLKDPIGAEIGFLDVLSGTEIDTQNAVLFMAGYAGLRPQVLSAARDCGAPRDTATAAVTVSCATMKGDSGAPWLVERDGALTVVGIFSSIIGEGDQFVSLIVPSTVFLDAFESLQ